MTWLASNLVHGRIGRVWMAVRDMDIAAELMGIRLLQREAARLRRVVVLLAGVAGSADGAFSGTGGGGGRMTSSSTSVFFDILFMVIIGGLGSLIGSFLGAALHFHACRSLLKFMPASARPADPARQPPSTVTFMAGSGR